MSPTVANFKQHYGISPIQKTHQKPPFSPQPHKKPQPKGKFLSNFFQKVGSFQRRCLWSLSADGETLFDVILAIVRSFDFSLFSPFLAKGQNKKVPQRIFALGTNESAVPPKLTLKTPSYAYIHTPCDLRAHLRRLLLTPKGFRPPS